MVEAEADDAADMVKGHRGVVLEGGQGAGRLVDGDVTADAIHVQQRADLADGHLELARHVDLR